MLSAEDREANLPLNGSREVLNFYVFKWGDVFNCSRLCKPSPLDEKESGWQACPADGHSQMPNSFSAAFDCERWRKTKKSLNCEGACLASGHSLVPIFKMCAIAHIYRLSISFSAFFSRIFEVSLMEKTFSLVISFCKKQNIRALRSSVSQLIDTCAEAQPVPQGLFSVFQAKSKKCVAQLPQSP